MKIRKSLLVVFALFAATVVCLYGAVSANLPFVTRIAFGAAAAVCYVLFPLIPYFRMRASSKRPALAAYVKDCTKELLEGE